MIRYAIPVLVPIAALGAVATPAAAEVTVAASGPLVELSITENVAVDPDIANVSAGFTSLAPTAVEAMRQNAEAMRRVVDRIEALGIDEDDVQTSALSLNAEYVWDEATRTQRFSGYRAANRVNVILRDIPRTGDVLDALVAAGANDIGGIGWEIDDPEPAQDQARQAAFATGRERALAYARAAGYSDIRLLEVSEIVGPGRPMPYGEVIAVSAQRMDASTPVMPGQVQASVTVNFTFEMTR